MPAAVQSSFRLEDEQPWNGWTDEEMTTTRIGKAKGAVLTSFFIGVYILLVLLTEAPDETLLPKKDALRTVAQVVLALMMLVEMTTEVFLLPATTKDLPTYPLMQTAGKTIYMTYWILSIQTIQQVGTAVAEIALFADSPMPKLMTLSNQAAINVDTLGVTLTLLFLRLNYFEAKWREEVKEVWESRGTPMGFLSLLGHVPSLPVAILDLVVKHRDFFRLVRPNFLVCCGLVLTFTASYTGWAHIWWYVTDYKCWPYPFLHDLNSCVKRMGFVAVITIAMIIIMAPMYFVS